VEGQRRTKDGDIVLASYDLARAKGSAVSNSLNGHRRGFARLATSKEVGVHRVDISIWLDGP
jgi:hypothetical protein